jgi:hypothetical protein
MSVLHHPMTHTLCSPAAAGSIGGIVVATLLTLTALLLRREGRRGHGAAVTIRWARR